MTVPEPDGPVASEEQVSSPVPFSDQPVDGGSSRQAPVDAALTSQLEALLFISDEGLSAERLAVATGVPVGEVSTALDQLAAELLDRGSGLTVRLLSTGWRMTTSETVARTLERFVVEGHSGRLSQAALETLAVIAYRQPVSRGRIAAIRGVAVDGVVRTLLSRSLIEEAGVEPSGATLYAVSALFLDKLGVTDIQQLPSLAPLLPDIETMDWTDVNTDGMGSFGESEPASVDDRGQTLADD